MSDYAQNPYLNPAPQPPLAPAQEKQFALLTHLLSAFFGFIPALIMFLLYKDRGPFVRAHVVTEWNFQLTALIAQGIPVVIALVGWATSFSSMLVSADSQSVSPAVPAGIALFFIGYVLAFGVGVARLVFCIIAAVAAQKGRFYRYPVAIRFVRV